jgi:hypothetical protein
VDVTARLKEAFRSMLKQLKEEKTIIQGQREDFD